MPALLFLPTLYSGDIMKVKKYSGGFFSSKDHILLFENQSVSHSSVVRAAGVPQGHIRLCSLLPLVHWFLEVEQFSLHCHRAGQCM